MQGWNLVGALALPVGASSAVASGGIGSRFYGFSRGYEPADTLYPGKAYWVKVDESGMLYLDSGQASNAKTKSQREGTRPRQIENKK
jgi:hypothetical protein